MPIHDWSRVPSGLFHDFHQSWSIRIKDALNAVTGKDVVIDVKLDPALIGGLVVKLGSRMVDSSLRTKLNMIKHAMKEVS